MGVRARGLQPVDGNDEERDHERRSDGDGGPGNSGGLGFKPRGLNLSDYNGVAAGYLDDKGERASVFIKDEGDVPRLVKALLARHDEESGAETGPVRGMPLGYEPLSAEDIQLVESWVAQGRPR